MTTKRYPAKKCRTFVLLMLAVFLCVACGSKLIRGAAPLVRMNELSHQDNNIEVQLSIRNLNGVPLDVEAIDFGLSIDDEKVFTHEGPVNTNITANGTETLSLEVKKEEIAAGQASFQFADIKDRKVDLVIEQRTATMTYLKVDTGWFGPHGMGRLLLGQIIDEISEAGDFLEDCGDKPCQ